MSGDDDIALRIELERLVYGYSDEPHVEGCEGEPTCGACWVLQLRRVLDQTAAAVVSPRQDNGEAAGHGK